MSPLARKELTPWWAEWLDYLRDSAKPVEHKPTFADWADYIVGIVAFVGLVFAAGYATAEMTLASEKSCATEANGRPLIATKLDRYGNPVECRYLPTKRV